MLLALGLFLLHSAQAFAQEINETEAQRLQGLFQTMLEERQAHIASDKDRPRTLEFEGEVTVEPAEEHYAITLPSMNMKYKDGGNINIGIVVLNVIPHDEPGQLKMTMALPTPIIGFDEDGTETMRIAIGNQQAAGIWHEELETFIKLDAVYSDIKTTFPDEDTTLEIPEFRANYNLEKSESGRWSGPVQFDFINMAVKTAKDNANVKIAALSIQTVLDEFAPEAFQTSAEQAEPSLVKMADGAKFKIGLKGFKASKTPEGQEPENISLAIGGVDFSFDDALTGSIDAEIGLNFAGLLTSNVPDDIAELIPKNGKLALTHHNIPLNQLGPIIDNDSANGALGLSLLFKIPAVLAQAGSYLEIQENSLSNDNYDMNMNAVIRADITAVNSATVKGTLKFAGLDKVLSLTQVAGTDLNASTHAIPMRTLARFLERLKPLARVETDDKWGFIHVFDFEMNETGQTLVNGKDTSSLNTETQPSAETTPPVPDQADL